MSSVRIRSINQWLSTLALLWLHVMSTLHRCVGKVTNPFGVLTPGGYLNQKAMEWIDHFTLSGLSLLERSQMTSRYLSLEHNEKGNHTETAQRIHLLDFKGSGALPPVILLHGISSCGADYYPLVRELQKSHVRVIALDLPGHGLSASSLDMALDELVDLAVAVVQRCIAEVNAAQASVGRADERCFLVGNSLGGFIACKVAAATAADVGGLVLMSPAGAPLSENELARVHSIFQMETLRDACDFVELVLGRSDSDAQGRLKSTIPFGVRHVLGWAARERCMRPSVKRIFDEVTTMVFKLSAEELKSITCPVLLVWGGKEEIFLEQHFKWFEQYLSAAKPSDALAHRHATDSKRRLQIFRPDHLGHVPHLDGALLASVISAWGDDGLADSTGVDHHSIP